MGPLRAGGGKEAMKIKRVKSHKVQIYVAGDYAQAIQICRQFCLKNPFCVSVARNAFVYTGGMEDGICATAINYARFPATLGEIRYKAIHLGRALCDGLGQISFTVMDEKESTFFAVGDKR